MATFYVIQIGLKFKYILYIYFVNLNWVTIPKYKHLYLPLEYNENHPSFGKEKAHDESKFITIIFSITWGRGLNSNIEGAQYKSLQFINKIEKKTQDKWNSAQLPSNNRKQNQSFNFKVQNVEYVTATHMTL